MQKLHTVTRQEFNSFPVVNGVRQCPTANYSNLSDFTGGRCSFGAGSRFRAMSKFTALTSFGNNCVFGPRSQFEQCVFDSQCRFLPYSYFYRCNFGSGCTFAHNCKFHICDFENPLFGSSCYFNEHKALHGGMPVVKISGGILDNLYLFNTVDGVYAQNGYFIGPLSKLASLTHAEFTAMSNAPLDTYPKDYFAVVRSINQIGKRLFVSEHFEPKEQLVLPLTIH